MTTWTCKCGAEVDGRRPACYRCGSGKGEPTFKIPKPWPGRPMREAAASLRGKRTVK